MKKNIIWLASYPKSGNTWVRVLISNLLSESDQPVDINSLKTDGIASNRQVFNDSTLLNSANLTYDEIDLMRPDVYRYQSKMADKDKTLFIKVHDAYTLNEEGNPLFPADVSKGVVYIVRNPLDVVVSYAAHKNIVIDSAIDDMINNGNCFSSTKNQVRNQFRQKILSWDNHIKSWINQTNIPLLMIHYEDLHSNPEETVKKLVTFCGLSYDKHRINYAIESSKFEHLKKQEDQSKFKEKPQRSSRFFRSGVINSHQEILNKAQIQLLIDNLGATSYFAI